MGTTFARFPFNIWSMDGIFLWEEFRTFGRMEWSWSDYSLGRNEVHSSTWKAFEESFFSVTDWTICGSSAQVLKECSSSQADTWGPLVQFFRRKRTSVSTSLSFRGSSQNNWQRLPLNVALKAISKSCKDLIQYSMQSGFRFSDWIQTDIGL